MDLVVNQLFKEAHTSSNIQAHPYGVAGGALSMQGPAGMQMSTSSLPGSSVMGLNREFAE